MLYFVRQMVLLCCSETLENWISLLQSFITLMWYWISSKVVSWMFWSRFGLPQTGIAPINSYLDGSFMEVVHLWFYIRPTFSLFLPFLPLFYQYSGFFISFFLWILFYWEHDFQWTIFLPVSALSHIVVLANGKLLGPLSWVMSLRSFISSGSCPPIESLKYYYRGRVKP